MPWSVILLLVALASYLLGAIPFGYLVARSRGVDLFSVGSGNIGATNVGRVLGRKYGLLVFVLDLLKGALPVAVATRLDSTYAEADWPGGILPTIAAASAFLGHMFPVTLGFRGGKGVATGAGAVLVLVPFPTSMALLAWILCVLVWRYISLASIVAVLVLSAMQLSLTSHPWAGDQLPRTLFCLVGTLLVIVKHRTNLQRLIHHTEPAIKDFSMRRPLLMVLHVLALGFWFGGSAFFSFVVAPTQIQTFKDVVMTAPNDRTAYMPLVPEEIDNEERRHHLAGALFGAAVGPVFPKFYLMQTICGIIALATACAWWNEAPRLISRSRVGVLAVAFVLVVVGWYVSDMVSEVRLVRYDPDPAVASAARNTFASWHLVSLVMSGVTTLLAGAGLAMSTARPTPQPTP